MISPIHHRSVAISPSLSWRIPFVRLYPTFSISEKHRRHVVGQRTHLALHNSIEHLGDHIPLANLSGGLFAHRFLRVFVPHPVHPNLILITCSVLWGLFVSFHRNLNMLRFYLGTRKFRIRPRRMNVLCIIENSKKKKNF